MARSLFYLCHLCNQTHRSDVTPVMDACKPCYDDMRALRSLYTRIVSKHSSLRKVPIGQVMNRLWAWYEKQTDSVTPPPEPPPVLHTDELKDIF